ncbi:MAG: phosphate signaling complex protein PhoU [Desulfopila sp.]|jgi:phosphate transport system protein|nr:phosphate signaling complex protein PhoU [Desulfopila sp.]
MQPHYTFHHELEKLNKKLLELSSKVEDRVRRAAQVILTKDAAEIQSIIVSDYEIDELEIEVEEDCLKILALHQPVASDLRFIIAVIKINNEIERIADIAVSIALRVETISKCRPMDVGFDFNVMSEKVTTMLRMSLDALVHRDPQIARDVFLIDDQVDSLRNQAHKQIIQLIPLHPNQADCLINTYLLARHLERIADRATNIAEEVIYLVEGTIVRPVS